MIRPARVTVMSPQTREALAAGPAKPAASRAGEPLSDSALDAGRLAVLLRVHRRLALRTMATAFAGLFGLPFVLSWLPDLTAVRLLGVPIVWLVLGVGVYPLLLLLGWRHTRQAERIDDELSGQPR